MTETEKAALRDIMELNQRCRDKLLLKYGHGVRPSWVSTDVSRYEERIERARRTLGEIT